MARRKAESTIPTFPHLNPDYTAREGLVFPELKRSSTSSVHRSQLTPLFLLREYLSRGTYDGISNRIRNVTRGEHGYHFEILIDLDWQDHLITHQELEAEE